MDKKEKSRKQRQKWRQEEFEKRTKFKEGLIKDNKLEDHPKVERLWELAWGYGHSNGFEEVKYYFDEIADLLRD